MDSIKYVFVISNKFRYFYTTQVFTMCIHWKGKKFPLRKTQHSQISP